MIASDSSFSPHSFVNRQTILLVEDQPELRWMLKRLLESKGYGCLEAENGVEGLSVIDHHPSIGLILSDYLMPRMDGLLLLQALRQHPIKRRIPFILVTANSSGSLRDQALREGAFAILSKPYVHTELFQFLEQGMSSQAA
jgi:two-component system chemotaxis response regulator CheY